VRVRQLLVVGLTSLLACTCGFGAPASDAARGRAVIRSCVEAHSHHHQTARERRRESRRCRTAERRRRKAAQRRRKADAARARKREARARAAKRRAAVKAPPAKAPVAPSLIWNGDLSVGDTSQYSYVQQCTGSNPPKGVTVVSSPVHPGYAYSSRFTVSDHSVTANCPILGSAGHPNANAQSPGLFMPGDDAYVGFSTYFPSSFPNNVCTPWVPMCWMQIMEIYGQPYGGVPPIAMYVIGDRLALDDSPSPIWTSSRNITKDAWQDVVLHVSFSADPHVGYVELWLDGAQQTFANGKTRYYQATLKPGDNWDGIHANRLYLDQYRGPRPAMGTVTLYHGAAKVAQTYAQAAP